MRQLVALSAALFLTATLGAQEKPLSPDDQYVLGPDSHEQSGVPKGKVLDFEMKDSKTYPGFERKWWIYIPAQYDAATPACLMVFQDGGNYVTRDGAWRVPVVFDNLIHKQQMPVTVGVFINPGDQPRRPGEPERKRPDGRRASRSPVPWPSHRSRSGAPARTSARTARRGRRRILSR